MEGFFFGYFKVNLIILFIVYGNLLLYFVYLLREIVSYFM